jgi:hypothetical protein
VAALLVYFVIFLAAPRNEQCFSGSCITVLVSAPNTQENNKIDPQSSHNEFWTRFEDRDIVVSTIKIIDEVQMCSNIMEQLHQNSLLCR